MSAGVAPVFGIEVAGQNAELGYRIQIRDDRCSAIDVLFHIATVDNEGIGKFTLAIDGNRARIKISGWRKRTDTYVLLSLRSQGKWPARLLAGAPTGRCNYGHSGEPR